MALNVPEKPALEGLEARWAAAWEEGGVYRFDRSRPRHEVYSIDTPPPTVSGSLHVGHVFSYVHTDIVARYMRMRGREVFYPIGWDDNGLPTERRVQNYYGVRCDPSLPYDPALVAPEQPFDPPQAVSRRNFIEMCIGLTVEDEKVYEELWRHVGLSFDWTHGYATIGDRSRRTAQRGFLRNLARGEAYQQEAPVLWDIDFGTAVAQAELEDRERPGALHRVTFHAADGPVEIETTRPELIASCVALVAHPDDSRYTSRVGTTVRSPLFDVEVPVVAHPLAVPDKGTGIAMVCTFGDMNDVTWWRELDLPARVVVQRNGRLAAEVPPWITDPQGRERYGEIAGATVNAARRAVVTLLAGSGDLVGEPQPITHAVKFYEKGDRPLEIVSSRQWYLRNGGRDPALRQALLARGAELEWIPGYMQVRYQHWVEGLTGDWVVSRQRFFGVPIPVWYRLGGDGLPLWDEPIVPDEADLPVDPASQPPPGYDESQRGVPGGFAGDPDILDTWATSSLSPQIVCGWEEDQDLFARTFPMDLRPQAHEIIRTWLFSSVVRAHLEHGTLPWKTAAISGWIVDPERKKMSKSKGNVVTPMGLLEAHGSDGVRYWAASGRPGTDTAFDEGQMKVGRRLALKILNASRFTLGFAHPEAVQAPVTEPVDVAYLARLAAVIDRCTESFDRLDYAAALTHAETEFWWWTDNYVELVKGRAYGEGQPAASAHAALASALATFLRLFAPFLPFVTEEVWSWWQHGSVHRAPWPSAAALRQDPGADVVLTDLAAAVLAAVRKAKTDAKLSMRAPVAMVAVAVPEDQVPLVESVAADLATAGNAKRLQVAAAAEFKVSVDMGST